MGDPIYIFAGGGTGGHLYPGLAVAEELQRLDRDARIVFACSDRPIDRRILDPLDYGVVPQAVKAMPRDPLGWGSFAHGWAKARKQAKAMVRDLKPKAVLGLGGFAAAPVVREAARARIRVGMLSTDAVVGKANRYLSRHVDAVFTQFVMTAESYGTWARSRIHRVGCPIRGDIISGERSESLRHFGLKDDRKTLLIYGGSLGAASINEAIIALSYELKGFADKWQLLWFCGPGKAQEVDFGDMHAVVSEYCDRMDFAYAVADCVLCRSGASTVAELAITGTPSVLMPYPHHSDRQQWFNAAGLVEAGAAMTCEDTGKPEQNAENLRHTLLPLLRDLPGLASMAEATRVMARPDAGSEVANWLAATT